MAQVSPKNFKPISRTVNDDTSVLCFAKWNHFQEFTAAGVKVTAATIEVQANLLDFQVNGAADVDIGTYTGNSGLDNQIVFADANISTIQGLINAINGQAPGHPAATAANYIRRYRAGLGDFRPQFGIGAGDGLVAAATNILLGRRSVGLALLADSSGLSTANLLSVGLHLVGAQEGGGLLVPDHFESDYVSTTAGVKTPVRNAARRSEERPSQARGQVYLTSLSCTAAFAGNDKRVRVYDNLGNVLWDEIIGAGSQLANADRFSIDNPIAVGPPGSPLWVEVVGSGIFTDGPLTVSGFTRIF